MALTSENRDALVKGLEQITGRERRKLDLSSRKLTSYKQRMMTVGVKLKDKNIGSSFLSDYHYAS